MEQIVAEFMSLRDKLVRDTRLKDKLMLALKRNELQLKQARDALSNTQLQHERIQAQVKNTSSFLHLHLEFYIQTNIVIKYIVVKLAIHSTVVDPDKSGTDKFKLKDSEDIVISNNINN